MGAPGAGVENFLGCGYSLSWMGQLHFVFAWASPNVVRYLGERLAHVLMENYSNRPRGFYTVAHKIRKFILFWQFLEFTSLYLRNDKEYRHISRTKNKGGYLPPLCSCAIYTGVSFLSCLQGGSKHHWYNFVIWTFLTVFGVYFLISQKRQRISAHNEYHK